MVIGALFLEISRIFSIYIVLKLSLWNKNSCKKVDFLKTSLGRAIIKHHTKIQIYWSNPSWDNICYETTFGGYVDGEKGFGLIITIGTIGILTYFIPINNALKYSTWMNCKKPFKIFYLRMICCWLFVW